MDLKGAIDKNKLHKSVMKDTTKGEPLSETNYEEMKGNSSSEHLIVVKISMKTKETRKIDKSSIHLFLFEPFPKSLTKDQLSFYWILVPRLPITYWVQGYIKYGY